MSIKAGLAHINCRTTAAAAAGLVIGIALCALLLPLVLDASAPKAAEISAHAAPDTPDFWR